MDGSNYPPPALTYKFGMPYAVFLEEAAQLVVDHWAEVGSYEGVLNLNPAHEVYQRAENAGSLKLLTVRHYGVMCGYFGCLVVPHPRDRDSLAGYDAALYVVPRARRMGIGPAMVRRMLDHLQKTTTDAKRPMMLYWHRKVRKMPSSHLDRLGFTPYEMTYSKVLLP